LSQCSTCKTRQAQYQREHRTQHRAVSIRWADGHRDQTRLAVSRWTKEHPEQKRHSTRRRRASKLGAAGACTAEQLQARVALYGGRCYIKGCGKAYEAIDHVIPLAKGGSNWPSNLRPICKHHNSVKGAKMPDHFLRKVA